PFCGPLQSKRCEGGGGGLDAGPCPMMPEQANRARYRDHRRTDAAPPDSIYPEPPSALGAAPEPWTPKRAERHYHVRGWGAPYFSVNEAGHVQATPDPESEHSSDLYELVEDLKERGLDLPLLIRFPDIIGHRIQRLNEAFQKAIEEYNYEGRYQGVFPVKVNQ